MAREPHLTVEVQQCSLHEELSSTSARSSGLVSHRALAIHPHIGPVVVGRDKSLPLLRKVSGPIPRAPLDFEHNCT